MNRSTKTAIYSIIIFFALLLAVVVFMNVNNTAKQSALLEDSVKSQLISVSVAARSLIDPEQFASYNEEEDVLENAEYARTLAKLRELCASVGAEYIYALKEIGGEYYFVFDTDTEIEDVFIPYELSQVHYEAFEGKSAADVMNVSDIYGSFNTGAVPIYLNGEIIGIVSTDISDIHLQKGEAQARTGMITLISVLGAMMLVMLVILYALIRRINNMQAMLERQAHYDQMTGLPNRRYLFEHLDKLSRQKSHAPFALVFIDIDNFKRVNDSAGHDAGDELLVGIAKFLKGFSGEDSMAFRPAAGQLNIAARIGGDEFLQIVSGISTCEEAIDYGNRLIESFHHEVGGRFVEKYEVGLSIGIALYPYHSLNYHVLIKYADIAMYHSKKSGKNNVFVYHDEMKQKNEK